jgi:hypothetical protein
LGSDSNDVLGGPALERADLTLLLRVYRYNAAVPGAPFLILGRGHRRARALMARGLLRDGGVPLVPHTDDALTVLITRAGVDAYNAAQAA